MLPNPPNTVGVGSSDAENTAKPSSSWASAMLSNPPNTVDSSDAVKPSSSVCGGGSEDALLACSETSASALSCSDDSALTSSPWSALKFSKEPRVPQTLAKIPLYKKPLFEESTDNKESLFLPGVPTEQVLIGTVIRNLEEGYEKLVIKLRRFGKVRAISVVGYPSALRLAVQYKSYFEAQAAFEFYKGSDFARVTPFLDSQTETVKFPFFPASILQLYKTLMVMNFNVKKIFVVPEEPTSKYVIFHEDFSPHFVCEVLLSTAPLLGAVVERPFSPSLFVATTKILVGTFGRDLQDLYRRVVVLLHLFGSVRAISVVGDAPRLRVAVEFAKTQEAQKALDYFDGSVFTCDFPSRLDSHEETLKIRNYKGSVMQLFRFLVHDIECNPIKVYLVPEEEYGHFVDLGYGSSAKDVRGAISCTAPWLGTVVERPYYSRMAIDVNALILGSEKRLSVTLVNLPKCFDRATFREEFSYRLWDQRNVTLEQLCNSYRLKFNSVLKQNDGEASLKFRNKECLLIFYEEFEGVNFLTLKSAQEDSHEDAQEKNSKLEKNKRLHMYFDEHPFCY